MLWGYLGYLEATFANLRHLSAPPFPRDNREAPKTTSPYHPLSQGWVPVPPILVPPVPSSPWFRWFRSTVLVWFRRLLVLTSSNNWMGVCRSFSCAQSGQHVAVRNESSIYPRCRSDFSRKPFGGPGRKVGAQEAIQRPSMPCGCTGNHLEAQTGNESQIGFKAPLGRGGGPPTFPKPFTLWTHHTHSLPYHFL